MRALSPAFLVLLAGVAVVPIDRAADPVNAVTLTVDCPVCGPAQPFPHPVHTRPDTAASTRATWAAEARRLHDALRSITGLQTPLADPATDEQLDATLRTLIAAAESEVARMDGERENFERIARHTDAQNARVAQLATEIQQVRQETAQRETETAAHATAIAAARDELLHLQRVITEVREHIRQTRNRLFPRLRAAADRGWVLPPSSYRDLPAPQPVKTAVVADPFDVSPTTNTPADELAPRSGIRDPRGLVPLDLSGAEPVRRRQLDQLAGLVERARVAAARRDEARGALEPARPNAIPANLAAQESQLTTLLQRRNAARNALAEAQRTASEAARRLEEGRNRVVHAVVEWCLYQHLARHTEALHTEATATAPDTERLARWREAAATTVLLGSNPARAVAEFPTVYASGMADVQRDVGAALTRYALHPRDWPEQPTAMHAYWPMERR